MGHLQDVAMTYGQHAKFSFSLSYLFLQGSICAFIHAICPCCFVQKNTEISTNIATKIHETRPQFTNQTEML